MRSSLSVSPRSGSIAARLALVTACVAGTATVAAAPAGAESLTLETAVERAIASHPDLVAARARVEAAEHGTSEMARRLAPSIHLGDEVQIYDKPFAVSFAAGPLPAGMAAPELVVRDRVTHTFSAALAQPLLGLGHLNEQRLARAETGAAGKAQLAALEASVRQSMAASFLSHFEARALEEIASASVKELSEQLTVARARLSSGVITNADLLRVETAVANAEQQVIAARSQAMVARASVLVAVGTSPDDPRVELVEPRSLLEAANGDRPNLTGGLKQAQQRRPELASRAHDRLAAEHAASASGWLLLPDVDFEAAYVHVDGQQFAPKDSAFVGVKAQWAIWEWGASWQAHRAAEAQARAAAAQAESERRRVEVDVATSVEQGAAARASVDAADKALASAQEAYRVTSAQLQAGAATTTDLLEAQSALSQARLNLTRAHYALALAHVSYRHAVGD